MSDSGEAPATLLGGSAVAPGLLASTVRTSAYRAIGIAVALVMSVVVTRSLGTAGRGELAVAVVIAGLAVQLGNGGLHSANTYYYGRNPRHLGLLLGNCIAFAVIVGVLVATTFAIGSVLDASWLPIRGSLGWLAVASVPVLLALLFVQNLVLATGAVGRFNLLELGSSLGQLAAIVGVAVTLGLTPAGVVGTTVVVGVGLIIVGVRWLWDQDGFALGMSATLYRDSLAYGAKAYVASLASFVVVRSDVLLVDRYRGAQATGIYTVAATMTVMLLTVPSVVSTLMFPRLATMTSAAQRAHLASRALKGAAASTAVLCLLAVPLARVGIEILYGNEFAAAASPFLVLLPGAFCLAVASVANNYLAASGMPPITYISSIVAAALNIGLNVLMIPRHGIVGAAASSSIAYAVMAICTVWAAWASIDRSIAGDR